MKLKDYLYYSENGLRLYSADCLDVMRKLPDDYVDLVVTDPPYGYSFMGKNWDKVIIPVSHWKECLRVLKLGAFAFVMSAPRQDVLSRMIYNLQEAGFETGFSSIYWSYASGFPKASNVSKLIDKQECKKELTKKLGRKPIKKEFEEVWGNYKFDRWEKPKNKSVDYGEGKNNAKCKLCGKYRFAPDHCKCPEPELISPKAKKLAGSYGGFQPKPAVEIIIVAMKPLSEKTYVDQALKNGHGISWLDNCRIPYKSEETPSIGGRHKIKGRRIGAGSEKYGFKSLKDVSANNKGRFPANLICSDDVLNDGKIRKNSPVGHKNIGWKHSGNKSDKMTKLKYQQSYGDSGSYSRYFDLDKWWSERVKKLPPEVQKVFPYLIVPKASKSEKNKGCENLEEKVVDCLQGNKDGTFNKRTNGQPSKHKNNHPTVKPLKLMSYLITLGSRENDIILDPFAGSGTTLIASKILNRKGIGIELSKEYCEIAKHRIKGN